MGEIGSNIGIKYSNMILIGINTKFQRKWIN